MRRFRLRSVGLSLVAVFAIGVVPAAVAQAAPLTVTTSSLPAGELGVPYSQTLEATGGAAPYTWSLAGGSLPEGLSLNRETGAISGVPSGAGTSSFTVEATDSSAPTPQSATAGLSITVRRLVFSTSFQNYDNIESLFGQESHAELTPVAVGPSGEIYAAEQRGIVEFNSTREFVRRFGESCGNEGPQTGSINGIVVAASGEVYVSRGTCDEVEEFSSGGEYLGKFGEYGSGDGQLHFPTALAIDPSGDVWVLDSHNYRVQEFSSSGEYLSQFGDSPGSEASQALTGARTPPGQIGWALGLAYSDGHLYIAEPFNSRVQEFTTGGEYVRAFDEQGAGQGRSNLTGFCGFSIAADPATGDLYVLEAGGSPYAGSDANNRVQEFDPGGTFITAFGSGGLLRGQMACAKGVAVGPAGKVYIADTGRNLIDEWVPGASAGEPPAYATSFTHYETSPVLRLGTPEEVAAGPSGDIYVHFSFYEHILEFNSEHTLVRQFGEGGGSDEGQFERVRDIATDAAGDVYVTEDGNERVQEFSSSGGYVRQFGTFGSGDGQFNWPAGIAVDSSGDVWVLDADNHRVEEFTADGEFVSKFGEAPGEENFGTGRLVSGSGQLAVADGHVYLTGAFGGINEFSISGSFIREFDEGSAFPWAIAPDPRTGNLFVSELEGGRVREFGAEGNPIASYGSSGEGEEQLLGPQGLAVGRSGTLYVADSGNQQIDEWAPQSEPVLADAELPAASGAPVPGPGSPPARPASVGGAAQALPGLPAGALEPGFSGTPADLSELEALAGVKRPARAVVGCPAAARQTERGKGHARKRTGSCPAERARTSRSVRRVHGSRARPR